MARKLSKKSMAKMVDAKKHLSEAITLLCSIPDEQYQEIKKVFRTKTGEHFSLKDDQFPATVLTDVRDAVAHTIKGLE